MAKKTLKKRTNKTTHSKKKIEKNCTIDSTKPIPQLSANNYASLTCLKRNLLSVLLHRQSKTLASISLNDRQKCHFNKFCNASKIHSKDLKTKLLIEQDKEFTFTPKINKKTFPMSAKKPKKQPKIASKPITPVNYEYLTALSRSKSPEKNKTLYQKVMKEEGCSFRPHLNENRILRTKVVSTLPSTTETYRLSTQPNFKDIHISLL